MKTRWLGLLMLLVLFACAAGAEGALQAKAGWPLYGCAGETLYFNGAQSEGEIQRYTWDFGDGTPGDGPTPVHAYQAPGTYTATLTLEGPDKEKASGTVTVHIEAAPPGSDMLPFRALMVFPSDPIAMPWDRVHTDSPDVDPDAPEEFYNLDYWAQYLPNVKQAGYNALVFVTNHPYPYLVAQPEFPAAQPIADDQLASNHETFRRIIEATAGNGVTLHFLVYNIFVTEPFARAHGLPNRGAELDTPLVRRYLAGYVKALYDAYPQLGGCVVTVGESPLGCVDYCDEALMQPMAEAASKPIPVLRDQGIYPEEIRRLARRFGECRVLVKLTEEQYLGDTVGPRASLLRQATGMPIVNLVGWLPPGLYFGSYQQVRDLVASARTQHSAGLLVQGGKEPEWLLRAAFGYYMTHAHPTESEQEAYFEKLVTDKFGPDTPAALLLATGDQNGRILTTVRKQLYSRNWNYRAQFGLLLDSVVSLPSFSAFRQESTFYRGTSQEGDFTGWFPRERVMTPDFVTVREYAHGEYANKPGETLTPEDTIQALRKMAAPPFSGRIRAMLGAVVFKIVVTLKRDMGGNAGFPTARPHGGTWTRQPSCSG